MTQIICATCEKPFELCPAHARRRKTCSKACRQVSPHLVARQQRHTQVMCEHCGRPAPSRKATRFCSRDCVRASWAAKRREKKPRKRWTEEEVAIVREGIKAGKRYAEIAAGMEGRSHIAVAKLAVAARLTRTTAMMTEHRKRIVREMLGKHPPSKIGTRLGIRVADVLAIAAELGLKNTYVNKSTGGVRGAPPAPAKTTHGYSQADIAWAIEHFKTNPEARAIAAAIAGPAKVAGAEAA